MSLVGSVPWTVKESACPVTPEAAQVRVGVAGGALLVMPFNGKSMSAEGIVTWYAAGMDEFVLYEGPVTLPKLSVIAMLFP